MGYLSRSWRWSNDGDSGYTGVPICEIHQGIFLCLLMCYIMKHKSLKKNQDGIFSSTSLVKIESVML